MAVKEIVVVRQFRRNANRTMATAIAASSSTRCTLRIEVSVLTPLVPTCAEAIVVGIHGLMIRHAGMSGLLLPQVPVEHGWDRETFLDHVCLKAGLARHAWREEIQLFLFEAEVF